MSKFCKDCRHHLQGDCLSPRTHNAYGHVFWAKTQRQGGWLMSRLRGTCGAEGRFFEIKPVRLVRVGGKAA